MFSVVNSVLWRALPYPESDRLVVVERLNYRYASGVSWPDFRDWREQSKAFDGLGAWREEEATFGFADGAELIAGAAITSDLFSVFGVSPLVGRGFTTDEDRLGGTDAIVLSWGLWQERFGGDATIVGESVIVDGQALRIVGVMERGFSFPRDARYWRPMQDDALLARIGLPTNSRSLAFLRVIGRLAAGQDAERAAVELAGLHARIREEAGVADESHRILVEEYRAHSAGDVRATLFFLLGSAGLVLLVASANVAGLALARASQKEDEFATRAMLGASRRDLRIQALSESLVLAAVAGVSGLAMAHLATRLILRIAPAGIPRLGETTVDASVVAFSVAVTLVTAFLLALAPAVRAGRARSGSSGRRIAGADRASVHAQHALVIVQVAMAVLLLSAAGLLARSYARLMAVDPGYEIENVWSAWVSPAVSAYDSPERVTSFYARLLEGVRALPGIVGATTTYAPPLRNNGLRVTVAREGEDPVEKEAAWINSVIVGDSFFAVSGIPLLAGRPFDERDRVGAPPVAIVSRATAEALWPEGAIGQRFRYTGGVGGSAESFDSLSIPRQLLTIVGVAADVRRDTLSAQPPLEFYRPHAQVPWASQYVIVRTAGNADDLASRLRRLIWSIDASVPIRSIESLATQVRDHTAEPRLRSFLVVCFATLSAFLAMLGVYAVLAISVARRTREMGVRMALGATGGRLRRMVLARGLTLVALGSAVGSAVALASGRALASMLFELQPADPVTLLAVLLLMTLAAVLACWLPARRAARVDPIQSMHHE